MLNFSVHLVLGTIGLFATLASSSKADSRSRQPFLTPPQDSPDVFEHSFDVLTDAISRQTAEPSPAMTEREQTPIAQDPTSEVTQEDNDDDDAPMIHVTPSDHATWAPQERDRLRSEGQEAFVMSELPGLCPRREGEPGADYAKRYSDFMNDLIRQGVSILSDQITHNCVPNMIQIDGHEFDVGPNSGITKREYREFVDCAWSRNNGGEPSYRDIPERFLKFEIPVGTRVTYDRNDE